MLLLPNLESRQQTHGDIENLHTKCQYAPSWVAIPIMAKSIVILQNAIAILGHLMLVHRERAE